MVRLSTSLFMLLKHLFPGPLVPVPAETSLPVVLPVALDWEAALSVRWKMGLDDREEESFRGSEALPFDLPLAVVAPFPFSTLTWRWPRGALVRARFIVVVDYLFGRRVDFDSMITKYVMLYLKALSPTKWFIVRRAFANLWSQSQSLLGGSNENGFNKTRIVNDNNHQQFGETCALRSSVGTSFLPFVNRNLSDWPAPPHTSCTQTSHSWSLAARENDFCRWQLVLECDRRMRLDLIRWWEI
mmetsp:Transcript_25507/g.61336  ORF Transcript_25507/g.61336 Transcript_25507/m.61336 type:complete len:243 (-) Transcript_25507:2-730(-)